MANGKDYSYLQTPKVRAKRIAGIRAAIVRRKREQKLAAKMAKANGETRLPAKALLEVLREGHKPGVRQKTKSMRNDVSVNMLGKLIVSVAVEMFHRGSGKN